MKNLSLITVSAAVLALAAPAFAADVPSTESTVKVKSDANGNYDKTSNYEHTDAAGTTTKADSETKTKVDGDGNVKKTETSESTTDPKGLMNKTTTKSTTTSEQKSDGGTDYHHKVTVNGKTVEDEKGSSATH